MSVDPNGMNPVAGIDVETQRLVEGPEDIMEQRKELAQRMQQADQHEASQISRTGMYRVPATPAN